MLTVESVKRWSGVRPSVRPSVPVRYVLFSSVDAVAGVCSKCHTKQQHQRRTRTAYVSVLLYENNNNNNNNDRLTAFDPGQPG